MPKGEEIKKTVQELLAQHLGVEPDDVSEEDTLTGDLHMHAADMSEFLEILESKDMDTTSIDLTQIETVGDLIEALGESSLE